MRKLYILLLALPLLFTACNTYDDSSVMPEPLKPSLTLTSESIVEFTAEGGEGLITYDYHSGTIGGNESILPDIVMINIRCDAEWVSVDSESPLHDRCIRFGVAPNDEGAARETTIRATIDHLAIEVEVRQSAAN